jgi:hypothetical protein
MTAKTPSSTGQEMGNRAKFAAGNYIKASPDSITAALAGAAIPDDFRFPWSMHPELIPIQSQV